MLCFLLLFLPLAQTTTGPYRRSSDEVNHVAKRALKITWEGGEEEREGWKREKRDDEERQENEGESPLDDCKEIASEAFG